MDGLGIISIEVEPSEVVLRTKPFRTIREIKVAVAKRYRITVADLESGCRRKIYAIPRQIAMALSYKKLKRYGYSMPLIAREFGDRHHTTVLFACRKFGIPVNPFYSARTVMGLQRRMERAREGIAP